MTSATTQVVIWGASGHALVVADILGLDSRFEVAGFLDDVAPHRKGEAFGGSSVLGSKDSLSDLYDKGIHHLALGVGNCRARLGFIEQAQSLGYTLVTAIHPSAVVASSAAVGEGSVLCAGSVVNPAATLGLATIVNTCASVDHECILGDAVHVAPGSHLAGCVEVGNATLVGVGSSVKDHVKIGAHSTIGAGAVVVSDIPSNVVAYGNPARISGTKQ